MKCPNKECNYVQGWDSDIMDTIEGGLGDFYSLPIKMERNRGYKEERETVYACPKCGILFIVP